MKNKRKVQTIILFFISILGLGTIIGILYFNDKTNTQKNKAFATEERLLQYEPIMKKELEKYNLGEKTAILLDGVYT
ncbi:hypothetical protein ABEY48_31475, partial [Bacillus mycoides]